ncbi:MAG: YihY/virulence factor BrkB family protein [Gemmatimonadaceae bacterium]|jgi:membrane protein
MNAPPAWQAARLRDTVVDYARRLWVKGGEDDLFFLAGGVAYNILLAGVPFFLLLIAGIGYVLDKPEADSTRDVLEFLGRLLPVGNSDGTSFLEPILRDVVATRGRVGLLSALAFAWFSTRLFGTLRTVLQRVFSVAHGRGIMVGKLYDFGYTMLSSLLLVVYLVLSAYLAIMSKSGIAVLQEVGVDAAMMGSLEYAIGRVLAFSVVLAIFFSVYKYIPPRRVPWRQALVAATTTSVLFEVARNLFVLMVQRFDPASLYTGTLGALVIVVFWAYYAALIFIVGGMVGHIYALRRRRLYGPEAMEG